MAQALVAGDVVEVYNTGGVGLIVRAEPCGERIGKQADGQAGVILEGPQHCDGYNRWRIRWEDGSEGWSAEDWLRKRSIPSSRKFAVGDRVKVVNTGSYGLNVRSAPPQLTKIDKVTDGQEGTVREGPFYGVPAGSRGFYHFWKVAFDSGVAGWAAENWLEVVSADPPETGIPTLQWPLDGRRSDRQVLSAFGAEWSWTTCGGKPKRHVGVDLAASPGEPVYASDEGVVREVYQASSAHDWGQGIVIEHNRFTTVYLHVVARVDEGERVQRGQPIAVIADVTGTQDHLHYGVRISDFSPIAKRGALPTQNAPGGLYCETDPLFPEDFVDPLGLNYDYNDNGGPGTPPRPQVRVSPSTGRQGTPFVVEVSSLIPEETALLHIEYREDSAQEELVIPLQTDLQGNARHTIDSSSLTPGQHAVWVEDGLLHLRSDTAMFSVEANARPQAEAQTIQITEGTSVEIRLRGTDPEGDPLAFLIVRPPEHGTLSAIRSVDATTAVVTYAPEPGLHGTDRFKFKVSDGLQESDPATIEIVVESAGIAAQFFAGWNFLYPLFDQDVSLGEIKGCSIQELWAFDPGSGTWQAATLLESDRLFAMHVQEDCTAQIPTRLQVRFWSLTQGSSWYLISAASSWQQLTTDCQLEDGPLYLVYYNRWQLRRLGTDSPMDGVKAYFILVAESCTIESSVTTGQAQAQSLLTHPAVAPSISPTDIILPQAVGHRGVADAIHNSVDRIEVHLLSSQGPKIHLYFPRIQYGYGLGSGSALSTSARVQLFDLQGHRILDSGQVHSRSLHLYLRSRDGCIPANGVYLVVFTLQDAQGRILTRHIQKVVILR